jgi:hypothetical protein
MQQRRDLLFDDPAFAHQGNKSARVHMATQLPAAVIKRGQLEPEFLLARDKDGETVVGQQLANKAGYELIPCRRMHSAKARVDFLLGDLSQKIWLS